MAALPGLAEVVAAALRTEIVKAALKDAILEALEERRAQGAPPEQEDLELALRTAGFRQRLVGSLVQLGHVLGGAKGHRPGTPRSRAAQDFERLRSSR